MGLDMRNDFQRTNFDEIIGVTINGMVNEAVRKFEHRPGSVDQMAGMVQDLYGAIQILTQAERQAQVKFLREAIAVIFGKTKQQKNPSPIHLVGILLAAAQFDEVAQKNASFYRIATYARENFFGINLGACNELIIKVCDQRQVDHEAVLSAIPSEPEGQKLRIAG